MEDLKKQLAFALEKYPEKVEIAPIDRLAIDSARRNEKRPAWVKLAVPDDVVKGLKGPRPGTGRVLLVRIPDDVVERADSRIVLPGEVG